MFTLDWFKTKGGWCYFMVALCHWHNICFWSWTWVMGSHFSFITFLNWTKHLLWISMEAHFCALHLIIQTVSYNSWTDWLVLICFIINLHLLWSVLTVRKHFTFFPLQISFKINDDVLSPGTPQDLNQQAS